MSHYDVIIIGAGASGLMCAMTAGQRGRRVLVLEHAAKVGRKILISGGGRCNFTNIYVEAENYLSANPHFCKSALKRYTQWDFIALVEKYAIPYHERDHGQLFCDNSAREILDMLLAECRGAAVTIKTECEVMAITHQERFLLQTEGGDFSADSLVIATGGLSIPSMGASDFGLQVARQFGHEVLPPRAGLVPFMFSDHYKTISERLSGIAVKATLACGAHSFTENILFTHRGLSGPAVLQISNYWRPGDIVSVNLLPGRDAEELLLGIKRQQPKSLLRNPLAEYLPKRLLLELEQLLWPDFADRPVGDFPNKLLLEIATGISDWQLKPSTTEGYRTAEVTLGGVDTAQLSSKSMESRCRSGLFFIGEVVDVAGHLGGYNFQWAWSSGYAAGLFV
ncbi:MAG: NAD(P)/FAD-dependent oxidoreductase [Candidatus Sedimenticola sp. (ex Thyasira tokunagai)]